MKKKILLYIQVSFMDVNLEIIKMIRDSFDVYILIELPPSHLKSNIFSLDINLNNYNSITSYWDVANEWGLDYLADFFKGCHSVNFAIYKPAKSKKNFYNTSRDIIKYINSINFDYFHFDDFSARQAFILPFIKVKKHLILNIHDPTPHKGEFEWKRFIIRKLFYSYASYYITFSNFSKNELKKQLAPQSKIFVFNLVPYTVFKKFKTLHEEVLEENRYISFIGRLSRYKGVDMLLEAIVNVLEEFPGQKFLIGGSPRFGYSPNFDKVSEVSESVLIMERHLTNEEIANLISRSKLVVCPYIEATQSGVVMTAYALNCPVLVTNTGGLADSVSDNITGLIVNEISSEGISRKIKEFLRDGLYTKMHDNIRSNIYISELEKGNHHVIKSIYA